MGIIFRQSFKSSIYSYIGVVIGFLTTAILMPKFLSTDEIGVIRQIQSYAMIGGILAAFGLPPTIIRMFPYFRNRADQHNGFLRFILLISIAGAIVMGLLFGLFSDKILSKDLANSPLFEQYHWFIVPFGIAYLFFTVIDKYATAVKESTIGVFLKDVLLRFFILFFLLLFIFDQLHYRDLVASIVWLQYMPVIGLILFLYYKKELLFGGSIQSIPSQRIKEFFVVAAFGWLTNLGNIIVSAIDNIMLSKLTSSSEVGIYSTVFYFASLIIIPARTLGRISGSVLADHFKLQDIRSIDSIYKKSAMTQLIVASLLFFNLVLTIPFIFNFILPEKYAAGKWVIVFIGLSHFFSMATGIKFKILGNSPKYRWNTISLIIFIALLILTNIWLIPIYGINGAAIASLISSTLYNVLGLVLVQNFFKLTPFTSNLIILTLIGLALTGILLYLLPPEHHDFWFSFARAVLFTLIYTILVIYFKFSPDFNEQLSKVKFFGKYIRK